MFGYFFFLYFSSLNFSYLILVHENYSNMLRKGYYIKCRLFSFILRAPSGHEFSFLSCSLSFFSPISILRWGSYLSRPVFLQVSSLLHDTPVTECLWASVHNDYLWSRRHMRVLIPSLSSPISTSSYSSLTSSYGIRTLCASSPLTLCCPRRWVSSANCCQQPHPFPWPPWVDFSNEGKDGVGREMRHGVSDKSTAAGEEGKRRCQTSNVSTISEIQGNSTFSMSLTPEHRRQDAEKKECHPFLSSQSISRRTPFPSLPAWKVLQEYMINCLDIHTSSSFYSPPITCLNNNGSAPPPGHVPHPSPPPSLLHDALLNVVQHWEFHYHKWCSRERIDTSSSSSGGTSAPPAPAKLSLQKSSIVANEADEGLLPNRVSQGLAFLQVLSDFISEILYSAILFLFPQPHNMSFLDDIFSDPEEKEEGKSPSAALLSSFSSSLTSPLPFRSALIQMKMEMEALLYWRVFQVVPVAVEEVTKPHLPSGGPRLLPSSKAAAEDERKGDKTEMTATMGRLNCDVSGIPRLCGADAGKRTRKMDTNTSSRGAGQLAPSPPHEHSTKEESEGGMNSNIQSCTLSMPLMIRKEKSKTWQKEEEEDLSSEDWLHMNDNDTKEDKNICGRIDPSSSRRRSPHCVVPSCYCVQLAVAVVHSIEAILFPRQNQLTLSNPKRTATTTPAYSSSNSTTASRTSPPLSPFSFFFSTSRRFHHLCFTAMMGVLGVIEKLPSGTIASMARVIAECAGLYEVEESLLVFFSFQNHLQKLKSINNGDGKDNVGNTSRKKTKNMKKHDVHHDDAFRDEQMDWKSSALPCWAIYTSGPDCVGRGLSPVIPPLTSFYPLSLRCDSPPSSLYRSSCGSSMDAAEFAGPHTSFSLQEEQKILQVYREKGGTLSQPSPVISTTNLFYVHSISREFQNRMEDALREYTSTQGYGTGNSHPPPSDSNKRSSDTNSCCCTSGRRECWKDTPEKQKEAFHHRQVKEAKQALLSLTSLKRLQTEDAKMKMMAMRNRRNHMDSKEPSVEHESWTRRRGKNLLPYYDGRDPPMDTPTTVSSIFSSSTSLPSSPTPHRRRKTLRDYERETEERKANTYLNFVLEEKEQDEAKHKEKSIKTKENADLVTESVEKESGRTSVEVSEGKVNEDACSVVDASKGHRDGLSSPSSPWPFSSCSSAPLPGLSAEHSDALLKETMFDNDVAAAILNPLVTLDELAGVVEAVASFRYRETSFWGTVERFTRWQLFLFDAISAASGGIGSTPSPSISLSGRDGSPPSLYSNSATPQRFSTRRVEGTSRGEEATTTPRTEEMRLLHDSSGDMLCREVLRICFALAFTGQKAGYHRVMKALVKHGFLPEVLRNPVE